SVLKDAGLEFSTPETPNPLDMFTEKYFHSKRGFRHLWELAKDPKLKISIPMGFITFSKKESIEAAYWFLTRKKDFVLKINEGSQGIGIALFNYKDFPDDKKAFEQKLATFIAEDVWNQSCIVVEEKADVDKAMFGGSPNVELRILKDGRVVREYGCEQVLDKDGKTFRGVAIHKGVVSSKYIKTAFKAAELFGTKLSYYGYRGVFDMDLVVSKSGELFAVESNLRRTGGTHIHEFCTTLLGKNYWNKHYVVAYELTLDEGKTPEEKAKLHRDYVTVSKLLEPIKYDHSKKRGVMFVNPDLLEVGVLSLLVVGKNKVEVGGFLNTISKISTR
ncbi:MAG: hypothetical protein ACD_22C00083G0011, partial [uncultured bacterium]